ncbi:MAG TPA: A24 family peptidase [Solirubrobacteraceae bacterium]|nr:A24 family peptidase [Solirubrobacteraceae bacterium]
MTAVALLAVLVPAAVIDLRRRRIPNRLTAAGAVSGVVLLALTAPAALPGHVLAAVLTGGALLAVALARAGDLGMGDVKLAAVLAVYLGAAVLPALVVGLTAATIAGVLTRRHTIPLGPFLALGGVTALLA